jgi:hypothetical protein
MPQCEKGDRSLVALRRAKTLNLLQQMLPRRAFHF